ncbi:MAG: aldehyde dehydrogenase [Bacteroidales bacterium]|nr:aldehyde dehydrogenase [Bacteroidales bacterium]
MTIKNTSPEVIRQLLEQQRAFFSSGKTRSLTFRKENLDRLLAVIHLYETRIAEALWSDLHKSPEETFLTETSIVTQEIALHRRLLRQWADIQPVSTPWHLFPSVSRILYEPLGVSLIMAPWNYPFQLLFNPLVGAISAGCCSMLKPSPYTPAIARVMEEMIRETFDPGFVSIVQGDRIVNEILLKQRFDLIFFTGSPALGKVVMKAASGHLTPVVLELGGKSPCIVDEYANIPVAAKRIAWGKTINAGQTCIAPDYLFVHRSVKDSLLRKIGEAITGMYGENIRQSRFYPRIVNRKAMERLHQLMQHGKIVWGGEMDMEEKFIAPTIIDEVKPDFPVMQEEIFGPILPVLTFDHINEVSSYINSQEKPLALYYFGKRSSGRKLLLNTSSGGGCINDTILHIANHYMPFGGVGNSGMGKYHGYDSFLAFSNRRAMVTTTTLIDLPLRYPPFSWFPLLKKIL